MSRRHQFCDMGIVVLLSEFVVVTATVSDLSCEFLASSRLQLAGDELSEIGRFDDSVLLCRLECSRGS